VTDKIQKEIRSAAFRTRPFRVSEDEACGSEDMISLL